jgi:hypothetical protein
MTDPVLDIATVVIALGVLPVASKFLLDLREQWRRWRQPPLWPTRSVSGSRMYEEGADQRPVPMGLYHCPHDHRLVEVDYKAATGHCPACGRRYAIQFGQNEPAASS